MHLISNFSKFFLSSIQLFVLFSAWSDACEIELVIAMDVSRSVDQYEFDLMRNGTANAFSHPEIIELTSWMDKGMMVSVTQWSGVAKQKVSVPWRHVKSQKSLEQLSDEIRTMKRAFRFEFTAPAEALTHAFSLFDINPHPCRRRVIDLSGDGRANQGGETGLTADLIARSGVTINGLVIRGERPDPLSFYVEEVKRGAVSFIEIADGYDDFPRAILKKILREISDLYLAKYPYVVQKY